MSNEAVSIIICTYNRAHQLENTLTSIFNQNGLDVLELELIVVDNNSTDDTKDVIEGFIEKFGPRLRYVFEPAQGISQARNKGIQEAKGDILIFTDDDIQVSDKWVKNIIDCFNQYNCDAVGGRILPSYPENTPEWVKENADILKGPLLMHDFGDTVQEYNDQMDPFAGANMAFHRNVFEKLGGFRVDLGVGGANTMGEDTEVFLRLKNDHRKIIYCSKAFIWHPVERDRMNLKYIAQWKIKAGRYYSIVKDEGADPAKVKCLFGIPRYIFRNLLTSFFKVIISVFNKRAFLDAWGRYHINLGMIKQFREEYKAAESVKGGVQSA